MTLYHLLATNQLRSSATSGNVPALSATLRSDFAFDMAFVNLAGVVAPLEAPEGGSVSVKAVVKLTPESSAILLDAALVSNAEDGTASRYTAEWSAEECDSAAFRAAVLGKQSIQATLEIEVTHAAGTARATCSIILINAFLQPTDVAPDPGEDASWTWLKARLNAGDNVSFDYDEEVKELEINATGVAAQISAAAEKATPVDADKFGLLDSAASFVMKWLTWANLKATAKAYFDTLYAAISHAHSAADLTSGTVPDARFPATLPALNGSNLTNLNASAIATGTIDVARLPYVASGVQVVSIGAIADLDAGQQTEVVKGAVVTTTDGRRWIYSGSGSKTSEASYIESADVTPAWAVIADKPSTFAPSTHASAHQSGGGDAIKLDDLAAPDDNTDLNATTGAHGLCPKLGGGTTNFLRADGSWAAPAGGGGGALVRGIDILRGHTDAGAPASPPTPVEFSFSSFIYDFTGIFTFMSDPYSFAGAAADPGGVLWIDTSALTTTDELAAALASALNSLSLSITAVGTGSTCVVSTNDTGVDVNMSGGNTNPGAFSATGGGSGSDEIPPSGAVVEAQAIALVAGKVTKVIRAGLVGDVIAVLVEIAFKNPSGYYRLGLIPASTSGVEIIPTVDTLPIWLSGATAAIVARMVDDEGNPLNAGNAQMGGAALVWAIAEQA